MTSGPAPQQLAVLGRFFAVDVVPDAPAAPWQPLSALIRDSGVLAARIERVRDGLAGLGGLAPERIDTRVAASVAHMGLVARLLAPALAVAVHELPVGLADADSIYWQDELSAFPLASSTAPASAPADVVDGPVAELTAAVATVGGVGARTLGGNVASGLNSALLQVIRRAPERGDRARALVAEAFARPILQAETGTPGRGFRRRSCCLIYRAAGPGAARAVCGDCVLARPAGAE